METYVVHIKSGCENAVLTALKHSEITGYSPSKIVLIRHGGKWIKEEKTIFPGYILVKCDLSVENYYKIKNIDGVIRLLGSNNIPSPIPPWEEPVVRLLCNNGEPIGISEAELNNGMVIITSGLLNQLNGKIIRCNIRQKRATIRATIGGRLKEFTLSVNFK